MVKFLKTTGNQWPIHEPRWRVSYGQVKTSSTRTHHDVQPGHSHANPAT